MFKVKNPLGLNTTPYFRSCCRGTAYIETQREHMRSGTRSTLEVRGSRFLGVRICLKLKTRCS